jgi:hypothetical protein
MGTAFAEEFSIRNCSLLPIVTDKPSDSIGFRTFEGVEKYLRSANWCKYKTTSKMLGVFSKYRDQLGSYLEDPEVLKTVATQLQVGSIYKVQIQNNVEDVEVHLKVFGENGKDVYFDEKTRLDKVSVPLLIETIIGWLKVYETNIPYDGRVLGVLGDQITIDFGKTYTVVIGQEFKVSRLKDTVKHPLLKKVVSWDTINLANGKIFNISKDQALGIIKLRTSRSMIEKGDWVKLEKAPLKKPFDPTRYNQNAKDKFGRLGEAEVYALLSSLDVGTVGLNGRTKQGGFVYGVQARVEAWVTREYFVMGEYSKKFGTVEKKSGSPGVDEIELNTTVMKIAGGYKYLPLGFFYGPQVNVYGGYAWYDYTLATTAFDGYGANGISGFLVGVSGNLPLQKGIRLSVRAELLPFAKFNDEDGFFSGNTNANSMKLEAGLSYKYSTTLNLIGGVESLTNGARFSNQPKEVNYTETVFKFGGSIRF